MEGATETASLVRTIPPCCPVELPSWMVDKLAWPGRSRKRFIRQGAKKEDVRGGGLGGTYSYHLEHPQKLGRLVDSKPLKSVLRLHEKSVQVLFATSTLEMATCAIHPSIGSPPPGKGGRRCLTSQRGLGMNFLQPVARGYFLEHLPALLQRRPSARFESRAYPLP